MAIIRLAASAGAALMAVMALGPVMSQAQAPKAPLQLLPGPDQAKPSTRAAIGKTAKPVAKTANKRTRTAATRKNGRQAAALAKASSHKALSKKLTRGNARPASNAVASRQSQGASKAQRARVATRVAISTPAARPAATSRVAMPGLILHDPEATLPIVAQGAGNETSADHVMRDGDSVSLVGRLPWWRNDRMEPVHYGSPEAESKVLEAAAVWLATNGLVEPDRLDREHETVTREAEDAIEVADSGEINDIDLAAGPVPTPTFLQSLLALIGGAAAAAVATVRSLFV
jgi:hypothetical protein